MSVVSDQTIAGAAAAAGFPRDQLPTAVAVAIAESGGDATAHNDSEPDGSQSYGLWQINSVHSQDLGAGDWSDPTDNARMAFAVWSRAGRQWTPWTQWRNGAYLAFLARGHTATRVSDQAGQTVALPIPTPWDTGEALGELAGQASGALAVLTDRDLWVRIGIFAAGGLVTVAAIYALLWTLGERYVTGKVRRALTRKAK